MPGIECLSPAIIKMKIPYLSNVVTVIVKTDAASVRFATKLFTLHLERKRFV